ncbi:carbohydrate ABC transporter permease [Actinotalea sp. K2]|uniref:carbohydrate ABC transporter permease n=1 Tax=Actinotalea sp. K2 TaxID=2939438 RepID=UPI002017BAC2|nr:sugar ABC transporter permease [Actinotalea sp. K2]MCL3862137.1 sugar ABC transporter permease [Actinotalea sp. K2]
MTARSELTRERRASRFGRSASNRTKKSVSSRIKGDERASWGFLSPWLAGLLLITIVPMGASLWLSFSDYNLLQPPSWVGLENYQRLLEDPRLHNALEVTFRYVAISVPLQLALSLGLAVLLNQGMRGIPLYRSAFYLPSLLGGSVAVAVLWRQMFGHEGLVNQTLALFGIEHGSWIADPSTALGTLVTLNVWTFGAPMIIFLAALRQIPAMYYEAAAVDGASRFRQFGSITLPLLTPIIFFNLVLQVIGAFQAFTQAFVISGGSGGPSDSTMFYTLYLYQQGFRNFDMGYAAAMAWLLLALVGVFTAINFLLSRYWVFYND